MEEFCFRCRNLQGSVICILGLLLFATLYSCTDAEDAPIVSLESGMVSGEHVTFSQNEHLKPVNKYLGIPYAMPPIGELRFRSPQYPGPSWGGTRNGTIFGSVCPQKIPQINSEMPKWKRKPTEDSRSFLERNMSEDCLYLNVYAPASRDRNGQGFSVIVYIHGDSFSEGTGNMYDGSVLASYGGVIVVTFNYRLGIFGFLSNADSLLPGNYGLLDQKTVLQWVHDNIAVFGGDPRSVTVMGTGTGAACAGLLMMSNLTQGLFSRVIAESGSALASWAINKEPIRYFNIVKQGTGCLEMSHEATLNCLRRIPYDQFLLLNIRSPLFFYAFAPVVDRYVIKDEPKKIMGDIIAGRWNITGSSYLTGLSKSEGFAYVGEYTDSLGQIETRVYDHALNGFVQNNYGGNMKASSIIKDTLLYEYTEYDSGENNPYTLATALLDLISDHQWVTPAIETIKLLDHLGISTYLYLFTHRPKTSPHPRWAGPVHLDDLPFIFGAPLVTNALGVFVDNYTRSTDPAISIAIMNYFCNFAKTGNPNEPNPQAASALTQFYHQEFEYETIAPWPKYIKSRQELIYITTHPRLKDYYRVHKTALWEDLIPKIESKLVMDETTVQNIPREPTIVVENRTPTTAPSVVATTDTGSQTVTGMISPDIIYTQLSENTNKPKTIGAIPAEIHTQGLMVELSMVIAVGGFLLVLNLLILGFIYYLRDKKKIESKLAAKYLAHLEEERKRKENSRGFMQTTPDSGIGIASLLGAQSNGRSGTFGSVPHSRDSTIRINEDGDIEFEV